MSVPMKSVLPLALVLAGAFAAQSAAEVPSPTLTREVNCPGDRDCDGVADSGDGYPDDPTRTTRPEDMPQTDPGKPKITVTLPPAAKRTTSKLKSFSVAAKNAKTVLAGVEVSVMRTARVGGKTVTQGFDLDRKKWFTTENRLKYLERVIPKTKTYRKTFALKGLVPGNYRIIVSALNSAAKSSGKVVTFTLR